MTARRIRHTRRTVRSAGLLVVAAAAAFSLTACQGGSGDAAAGPEKKDSAATSVSASNSTGDSGTHDDSKTNASETRTEAGKTQAEAGKPQSAAGAPARTQTLPDGSTAKIYKLGEQHYRADIVADGSVLATIETDEHDAGLDANDMYIVLTLDGQVHAWMGGGQQGPGTFELAGGWKAKVTKVGDVRYRADIIGRDGSVMGTLNADEKDAGAVANGVYIVLSFGGLISAHE
ncbi:hypothetical protein [Streptomyces tsukubensis]|uniref:Lipoprotein n=1 Tax=Streptomyces tsukubensis TaxID=83656 RepID=A0A1V4AC88_9ACTN|nr:hypothetical protein [Streptomyces tsukubensis]OON81007.1 hypothetical protein B1H18_09265 [Streptomyces tsukubensis]QFR94844.1 hypothetical protein GBW32_19640 [Streptomyces tsukubensis]